MLYKIVFGSALDSSIISKTLCLKLNPRGGKGPKKKGALTDEQVKIFLNAIKGCPPYPFVMIGPYAGLRLEEILDLNGAMWN